MTKLSFALDRTSSCSAVRLMITAQVKDLLRRYPEVAEAALAAVAAISPADVAEPEARAAFVWILGHHGGNIQVCLATCGCLL